MKQTDQAIFLHRINYSESSLIATLYTEHSGIQKFMFQGGKKKSTALFPLSICEITFYKRPDSELGKLTEARPVDMLHEIYSNPLKSTLAFFIVDVLKQCLQTDQADSLLFQFLIAQIHLLNTTDDLSLFASSFLVGFSEQLGIEPQVSAENGHYFHLQDGDFSDNDRKGELVASGEAVLLIQDLLRSKTLLDVSKQVKKDALDILLYYYKLHIPRFDIENSLDVIKEVLYN